MPDPLEIVCLGCGCLCDDYPVRIDDGKILPADGTCARGNSWLEAAQGRPIGAASTFRGKPIDPEVALNWAALLLRDSRSTCIQGLTSCTVEAVREAIALADRLGARIERADALAARHALEAEQDLGRVTANLGEVRDRADLVVFWGCDPDTSHPRHGSRYSIEPAGRFIPDGRNGRRILVAGRWPNATARRADLFLEVPPQSHHRYLRALRELVRGIRSLAPPDPALSGWASAMREARYGAIFYDETLGDRTAYDALFELVRDLNQSTRCVALPLGGPGNASGAAAALTWQAGNPLGADFSAGYPRPLPHGPAARKSPQPRTCELALIVGGDEGPPIPGSPPSIRIGPGATSETPPPVLAFESARPGIDDGGSVVRCDGAWLRLDTLVIPRFPSVREWLRRLRECLDRPPS